MEEISGFRGQLNHVYNLIGNISRRQYYNVNANDQCVRIGIKGDLKSFILSFLFKQFCSQCYFFEGDHKI